VPPVLAQRFGDGADGRNYYYIWDYDRQTVKTSRSQHDIPETGPRPVSPLMGLGPPNPEPPTIRQRGEFREAYVNGPAGTRLLVGRSIGPDRAELRRTAWLLVAAGAAVLVIGLAGGWVISLGVVRPIRSITRAAQEISASNLSRRIDASEMPSELGTLATVLNDTFTRLDSAFQQQVRFTADASHELRTPLSVIHTHAQLALSRERSAEEYRRTIATCLRASSRMKGLVDSLLLLAGADAGRLSIERHLFNLQNVIEECITMVTPLANEKGITIDADLRSVEILADPARISQVAINLMSNAIRYNREKGSVSVKIRVEGADVLLVVADTGVGIPVQHLPHLFERFYRVDVARSRDAGGSGLGLAICKSIIDAHGGTITVESTPDQGSTFTVRLPEAKAEGIVF
jgi:heavy metal sensor kinase